MPNGLDCVNYWRLLTRVVRVSLSAFGSIYRGYFFSNTNEMVMIDFIPLKKDDWLKLLEKHLTPNEEGIHPINSIMQSGNICTCDAAFMCEHRAKVIIDFIKANTN